MIVRRPGKVPAGTRHRKARFPKEPREFHRRIEPVGEAVLRPSISADQDPVVRAAPPVVGDPQLLEEHPLSAVDPAPVAPPPALGENLLHHHLGHAPSPRREGLPDTHHPAEIPLGAAAANVNLDGYTGMRLTVSDGTPPAANEDNTVAVRPHDYQTSAGDESAELVICYVVGATHTPQRPRPPHLF